MKYQQPFGVVDPAASYEDGNRVAGQKGSVPPAKAIEQPLRELDHLINYAGLVPGDTDLQQVRKAIEALIAAATGGGATADYLLIAQARARLPIFPAIETADGRMNVSSPGAGTILVPPAVSFSHRGIYPVSTSDYPEIDRTFATTANKTYHCRWGYGAGFRLADVADAAYNPTLAAETSSLFDSSHDDMLIARVVTNAANVATITNLKNSHQLSALFEARYTDAINFTASGIFAASRVVSVEHNWARKPVHSAINAYLGAATTTVGGLQGVANLVREVVQTRYSTSYRADSDFDAEVSGLYVESRVSLLA